MVTNFDFLKKIDNNLYEIIAESEKLYRDEYFEQSMTQTRRFAEQICKNVLGNSRTNEKTFDDMLATLKDKSTGSVEEKEFLDDLYFIKKHGNASAHSARINKDGITALECLKRAFETAISYAVYYKNSSKNILNLHYDIELLATGIPNESLADEYSKVKLKTKKSHANNDRKISKKEQVYSKKTSQKYRKKLPLYWIFVAVSFLISFVIILMIIFVK